MKSVDVNKLKFAIIAVDTALFRVANGKLQVLLGEVTNPHFRNKKGLVGGVVRPNETAESAVRRHLYNKAGISKKIFIEQVCVFSKVERDPRGRVIAVAYLGLVHEDPRVKNKLSKIIWVPIKDARNLAYDHDEILKVAIERLRAKLGYTNIAQHLLPKQFTLTNLQSVYETILGRAIDKRNFRRKMLNVSLITKAGGKSRKGSKKPAQLFRFISSAQKIVDIL